MLQLPPDQAIRILHLEDSDDDHELTQAALDSARIDYTITRVETLPDFFERLRHGRFHVVIADYHLPGFTAIDAWNAMQQLEHQPAFIVLSNQVGEFAAVDIMRRGIADYVRKDNLDSLASAVVRAVQSRERKLAKLRLDAETAASGRRSAEMTDHLQTFIEQERTAVARDVHDEIGSVLAAMRHELAWIARHTKDDATREHVRSATELLQNAIASSQRIVMNLRPPILEQGLVPAIHWLAISFEKRTGVKTQFSVTKERIDAPDEVQLAAYRTAQEALTNIAKHAQCTEVNIDLSDAEGVLTLEIADNGKGIAQDALNKGKAFGLKGLHERARSVEGWLDVSNRQGVGTSIILSVPLNGMQLNGASA